MLKNFEVSKTDGIVVVGEAIPENLQKIRLINLLEPFLIYGIALIVIWVSRLDEDEVWWIIILGLLSLWMLVLSPYWHYEKLNEKEIFLDAEHQNFWYWFFECRGLGSIKKYYQRDETGRPGFVRHWDAIMKMTILWDLLFLCVPFAFEKEYNEILIDLVGNASTLTRIGMALIGIVVVDILLILFLYPVFIRLDNFMDGWNIELKWMATVGIVFVVAFNLFFQVFWEDLQGLPDAYAMVGDTPYFRLDQFNIADFGGMMTGYVLWGWVQQLLFLSIFSTMFARAFDLKNDPKAPYKAALPSALFFGLIHLPNFWLSIMTWLAGYFWALAFMKRRNLAILGLSHGFLGSLGGKLLPISFNVGPNGV